MNRTIKTVVGVSLCALSWSAGAQGVGLFAPGAILDPGRSVLGNNGAILSYSGSATAVDLRSTNTAPRTVLTPTGRYLITTDPATGYISSIIEVSRTRD